MVRAVVPLVLSLFVVFFVGPVFVLSATLILVMADNLDEITPAAVMSSPQATASVPVVESADESAMTPSNPTMAPLSISYGLVSLPPLLRRLFPSYLRLATSASPESLGARRT